MKNLDYHLDITLKEYFTGLLLKEQRDIGRRLKKRMVSKYCTIVRVPNLGRASLREIWRPYGIRRF
jgi:hypothetical protein